MANNIDIKIQDITGKQKDFKTLKVLISFLKQESNFWKKQHEKIPEDQTQIHQTLSFHENFNSALTSIENLSEKILEWDESTVQQQIHQKVFSNYLSQASSRWLWSGNPAANTFVECHIKHGSAGAGAFLDYVARNKVHNGIQNNTDVFSSVLLAYEFMNQDSPILKRRKSERAAISHLRNSLEKDKEGLVSEVDSFKEDFHTWFTESKSKDEQFKKVSKYLGEKKAGLVNNQFEKYLNDCQNKIDDLESTYEEKLRLSKPAEYWNKASKRYGSQGLTSALILLLILVAGISYLSEFFVIWLSGKEHDIKLNTIQGIVIFGSLLATFAFTLKVLSRLTFSSFHLMRDAQEREQLTYLYLSLSKDNPEVLESRELILQALFSRSETGLLSNENGPTMPTVLEALKAVNKGGRNV